MRWKAVAAVVLTAACGSAPPGAGQRQSASAVGTARQALGAAGDDLRSGWYPNQPLLAPSRVSAPDFGQLFDTPITGQVHAQPLLVNGRLLDRHRERRRVLPGPRDRRGARPPDPPRAVEPGRRELHPARRRPSASWAPRWWTRRVGTAYLIAKTYVSGCSGPAAYWAHAVDVLTLQERPGFPVQIQGSADNVLGRPLRRQVAPAARRADPPRRRGVRRVRRQLRHPAVEGLDLRGVDRGAITARWAAVDGSALGAGIWQTGGAPMVDGPGTFLVVDRQRGGPIPSPTPGSTPPGISARRGSASPSRATAR